MAFRSALTGSRPGQAVYRSAVAGRLGWDRWVLALRENRRPPESAARILAYHSIGTPSWGVNDVRPRDFERHLQIAVDDGWTFATPAQVLAEPSRRLLALTFDDGVRSVLHNAAPVLRHHGIPATMFVVTGWADGRHPAGEAHVLDWAELTALRESGVSLASHSVSHPDFGRLDAATARAELETSRTRMRHVLGEDVDEFAIPFGQSANWTPVAQQAAADAGYSRVYAQSVRTRPAGTVPRTFITGIDRPLLFRAALAGHYDGWEEWYLPVPDRVQVS
ncbi:polysaccharide deacetylase family protein [Pseudonocardia hydrocarbonoxydans]|uniref:polysaccharide deacetylase family protein n=1 Tax=Pseudonocardia hydrocarbonoxydans TaxID=76726 RepID=UPI0014768A30|nr:polysaccharide deacetylase family protein [Pseudonocardia hydrocarbonoxydans]